MIAKTVLSPVQGAYFRTDIEGMRAIAALPVLFFHVDPDTLPGGFIGVDLFFVISGYLITSSIYREVQAGHFRLIDFYARRIRRLYPALLAVVFLTLLAGVLLLFPRELRRMSEGAITSLLYVSNFYFAQHSDYFDDSQVRPFLHTWSLSVEEQFYLAYPFLILLVLRRGSGENRMALAILLGLIAAASFALAELFIRSHPAATFYMSPTRFWELAVGGLIAILPAFKMMRGAREAASVLGLTAIGWSLLNYSDSIAIPGVAALLPVSGIAILIKMGEAPTLVSRSLSISPARFFGRISYSIYLVHWPLIVMLEANTVGGTSQAVKLFVLAASIGLAYLLYRYVELPAQRIPITGNRRKIFTLAGAGTTALVATAAVILIFGGFRERIPDRSRQMVAYLDYDARALYRAGSCLMDSRSERIGDNFDLATCVGNMSPAAPRVLLIGDSHAAQYYQALRESYPAIQLAQITATGCRPLLEAAGSERCADLMNQAFHTLIGRKLFDIIIVAGRWHADDLAGLSDTAAFLAAHASRVYVIGPIVEYRMDLPRLLAFSYLDGRLDEPDGDQLVDQARRLHRARRIDARMDQLLEPLHPHVRYVSVVDAMCSGDDCATMTRSGTPLQFDYGHLTHAGAVVLIDRFRQRGVLPPMPPHHPQGLHPRSASGRAAPGHFPDRQ